MPKVKKDKDKKVGMILSTQHWPFSTNPKLSTVHTCTVSLCLPNNRCVVFAQKFGGSETILVPFLPPPGRQSSGNPQKLTDSLTFLF